MAYIIGKNRTEGGVQLFLGKVTSRRNGIAEGTIEKWAHLKARRTPFEIPLKDIVLDLGDAPHPGKIYGFDTHNLWTGKKLDHSFFGQICLFYKMSKEVGTAFTEALRKAEKKLRALGFGPMVNCVWLVQHPKTSGRYAGYYKHSKNAEKLPHELAIKPEFLGVSEMVYVIVHEFAHYMHANMLDQPKVNGAWIKLFNTSIKAKTVKKEQSQSLLGLLTDQHDLPSDFKSGLDEDQRLAWAWIMRTIKSEHGLTVKDLDTLFASDNKDEIDALWPKRTLHQKDLAPVISEYACVNPKETLAEAFAFHVIGKKLPPGVTSLVEKTIRMAKANQPKE